MDDLLGGARGKDRHRDRADRQRRKIQLEPLRAVVGEDRDAIATAQSVVGDESRIDQAAGDGVHPTPQLGVGVQHPFPVTAYPGGRTETVLGPRAGEQMRQVVDGQFLRHHDS